jgi:glycosyltransferase involved in cell wall biosynthesis
MGDVAATADAIIKVLSDTEFAARISRQAFQRLENRFDIKSTTREREELYRRLSKLAESLPGLPGAIFARGYAAGSQSR